MVTIRRYGQGDCMWCTQSGDGVEAEFKQGFTGFFCKRCFWTAVKVRHGKAQPDSAQPKGNGQAAPLTQRSGG